MREILQRRLLTNILAELGVIATLLGIMQFFNPDAVQTVPKGSWPWIAGGALIALTLFPIFVTWPGSSIVYRFAGGRSWEIEVGRGDLFEAPGQIVITVDRRVSTERATVGDHALIALLCQRWFGGDESALRSQLSQDERGGTTQPLGKLISIRQQDRRAWLFCLADPTPHGTVTTWQDLLEGLDELWDQTRRSNLPGLSIPVIGSGFARARLSTDALLWLIILSFHSASLVSPVVGRLRVYISPREFDARTLDIVGRLLQTLHYEQL